MGTWLDVYDILFWMKKGKVYVSSREPETISRLAKDGYMYLHKDTKIVYDINFYEICVMFILCILWICLVLYALLFAKPRLDGCNGLLGIASILVVLYLFFDVVIKNVNPIVVMTQRKN